MIAHNRGRKIKPLWTDLGEGDPIKVRELGDEHAEARYVTAEVERLVDEGVSRAEIAIFYRTNAQSRVLEDMLVRAQIGYQVIGGTKFYERAEIKDARRLPHVPRQPAGRGRVHAHRQLAAARDRADVAVGRVIALADTLGVRVWGRRARPSGERPRPRGAQGDRALHEHDGAPARARRERRAGRRAARGDAGRDRLPRGAAAERTIEAQGRIENLEEMVRVAREYDGTAEEPSLGEFLQQISLLSDADALRDDDGLVTLMTLHNAKGLEFPIVFILGFEDGVFPHTRALDEGNLEEERRLAYVGITRAMRDLYLTYARRRNVFGSTSFGMRSRFLDEIPRELTDQPSPGAAGSPFAPGRVASWSSAAAGTAEAERGRERAAVFGLGDDVVHAAFGDGVVTAVEPGGIVVVRFAGDGPSAS